MSKVKSFYWAKEVRIPFKYRKVKDIVKSILKSVEDDRDKGISISQMGIDYSIKYKYLILECLEKCFELKLITIPSFKRIGHHGYSDFYLIDIKNRLQCWYQYCLLNPEQTIDRVYGDFNSKIRQFTDLYNTGTCEMTYVFSLPQHIIFELMKKINDNFHYKDITLDYNSSLTYDINSLTSAITITECYDKAEESEKEKVSTTIYDADFVDPLVEGFKTQLIACISAFENTYIDDEKYFDKTKSNSHLTTIDLSKNPGVNFNEDELNLIKTLMLRKDYDFSWSYNSEKNLVISIKLLNNKERRMKNIKNMVDCAEMYGFKLENIDYSSIKNLAESNIMKGSWCIFGFNTEMSRTFDRYGEYFNLC